MYTLMELFQETIFRPLGGAAPWNFYTRWSLEIDQGYLVHNPSGTGVPQKNLIVKIKNLA